MSSFLPEHYPPSSAIRNNYRASVAAPTWSSQQPSQEYTGGPYRASIADPTWASHIGSEHSGLPGGMGSSSHHMRPQDQRYPLQPPPLHTEIPKRPQGFRRLRDTSDLKPNLEIVNTGKGRRADPSGGFVSPLKALTSYLHHTYHLVNPAFLYELSFNPRRVLTKPDKPMYNDGHDNEESDYILYVNDYLGSEGGSRYVILDILGQGTFGQVVKCQNMRTREICAVKVIKNKPAYFNQSMMEVTILEMLNKNWDPNDEHHILRLRDTFIHAKHLCLVFELLSSNLYELIKQNSFRGLSTSLVRVFTAQLLDALTVLNEARLIHCDLKPENILLKTLQTPSIKLVDFGSACHEKQTVYTYIQSRFYRSPEVLLGLPYASAIDIWSLGCIAVELFLGLPLFPGTSEYNQICRIAEMLGLPPQHMLDQGKQTGEFFNVSTDELGRKHYRLKPIDQYSREHNVEEQPSRRYFQASTLPDLIKTYPMARRSGRPADVQKEMANRASFIDFVSGLLNMDPHERWTPQQAKLHPFITGEKLTKPFKPPPIPAASTLSANPARKSMIAAPDAKHPYGGLQPSNTKSTGRTYTDAAAYSQHLAQQQAYNSVHQATAARQAHPTYHNPYAQDDRLSQQQQQPNTAAVADPKHQYAGLQPTSAKASTQSFSDSASYSQHIPQHQAYNPAHQVASSRLSQAQYPNPYAPDERLQAQQQHQQTQQHSPPTKVQAQASSAYSPNMYIPGSTSSHSHAHQHQAQSSPHQQHQHQQQQQQHHHHLHQQHAHQHAHAQAQAQAAAAAQRGLFSVVVDGHERTGHIALPPLGRQWRRVIFGSRSGRGGDGLGSRHLADDAVIQRRASSPQRRRRRRGQCEQQSQQQQCATLRHVRHGHCAAHAGAAADAVSPGRAVGALALALVQSVLACGRDWAVEPEHRRWWRRWRGRRGRGREQRAGPQC
ncbi:hypothetical protein V8E36_006668 [Tilletia maclaganii]